MTKLSATTKGLITGIVMILISVGIYVTRGNFDNNLQYMAYGIYVAGILWALVDFHRSNAELKTFKNYFTVGFRCFIAVTFLMVAFTYIFNIVDPSLKEQMANNYRADLVATGNKTPPEIEKMVSTAKDYFNIQITSKAIFGYLSIGAMVTVIASFILSQQKSNTSLQAKY